MIGAQEVLSSRLRVVGSGSSDVIQDKRVEPRTHYLELITWNLFSYALPNLRVRV
jgi:hypothetical protein